MSKRRRPIFEKPVYITRPIMPSLEKFIEETRAVFGSAILTNTGPYSLEFENSLEEYLCVNDCAVFCNGTVALQLAISAFGLGGEIITTPFTFPATVHVIAWNHINPVFCDIDPETFNIDASKIESLVTSETSAILPVHVYGVPCDVEAIGRIAKRHGLRVIYDAAAAFGVQVNGKSIGSFGDASMLSFHATKLFNTMEGGALTSSDGEFMERVRKLRNFGIISETEVSGLGINGKLNELQSIFGLLLLEKVATEIKKRKAIYRRYVERLENVPGISFQKVPNGTEYNYQCFPIMIDPSKFRLNRDELAVVLQSENVYPRRYFFPLCSNYPIYKDLPSSAPRLLTVANQVADNVLCLPIYGGLGIDKVDVIVDIVRRTHIKQRTKSNIVQIEKHSKDKSRVHADQRIK